MDISISCQNRSFGDLFIGSFRECLFIIKRLSLSLFMSRVGTNYYNAPPSTNQSTFFTNFTNGGSYFHNCYSLTETEFRIYFYFPYWTKISFLEFLNRELDLMKGMWKTASAVESFVWSLEIMRPPI